MKEILRGPEQARPFSFCEDYLDRILQPAPIEQERAEEVRDGDFMLDPSTETERLVSLGYDTSTWSQLLEGRVISHDIRAYIIAALSQHPRSLLVLRVNLRALDELDGLIQPMEDISDRTLNKIAWHTPALQWRLAQSARLPQ